MSVLQEAQGTIHSTSLLRRPLMHCRFVVPALKHQTMVVAQIASDSSKSVYSHQSPPRRKPLCPRTLHTLIFATPELCHHSVEEDRYILSRVNQQSTAHTGSLLVTPCMPTPTTLHRTAILCHRRGLTKAPQSTTREVLRSSLRMLKIK